MKKLTLSILLLLATTSTTLMANETTEELCKSMQKTMLGIHLPLQVDVITSMVKQTAEYDGISCIINKYNIYDFTAMTKDVKDGFKGKVGLAMLKILATKSSRKSFDPLITLLKSSPESHITIRMNGTTKGLPKVRHFIIEFPLS